MPLTPWTCAQGEAAPIAVACSGTIALGDLDSNKITVSGTGSITSFGPTPIAPSMFMDAVDGEAVPGPELPSCVTKVVTFAAGITLVHSTGLILLGAANRVTLAGDVGTYTCDVSDHWTETDFRHATSLAAMQDIADDIIANNGLLSRVVYVASATITIPAKATKAIVKMWGGSGGSGGYDSYLTYYGASTGAAGYLEKFLSGLVPGHTLVFVRGNHGVGPGTTYNNPTNGTAGTASTLASGTQSIATLTANGSAGTNAILPPLTGGAGGTATGGDMNMTGESGVVIGNTVGVSGRTLYSVGALPNGQNGTDGGMIIEWYR